MTRADPSKTVLIAGFLVSTLFHASLWGVASGFVKIGKDGSSPVAKTPKPPKPAAEPPPDEPRIRLGIDDSTAHTMTWLGFREATEHAGEVSRVEQSAMTPHAGAPVESAPPAPETAEAPKLSEPAPPSLSTRHFQESIPAVTGVGQRPKQEVRTAAANDPPTPAPKPPAPLAPPSRPSQPAPPGSLAAPGAPGAPSDKEAIASAIKKAPKVVIGQVLAADGLDIQTKSPKWAISTIQTRHPANPTVQITFGVDGKVIRAGFATNGPLIYNTGFDDVDQPLMSAIYTWTARGKHLAELTSKDPNGEVTILITIILNI